MKSIISKIAITGFVALCLSSTLQAKPVSASLSDTSKMSKMKKADKMDAKKPDKMSDKKMSSKMKKDTGKMSKM
jgi:hypothetical protein